MAENGIVIDLKENNMAVVSFNRTEACAKCKACMSGFYESQMIMEARNDIGAKKGDTVVIELKGSAFLTASVIMYAAPLFMMMLGFFTGSGIAVIFGVNPEIFSFFFGIALLALSYITIRLCEKRIKKAVVFLPYIAKIGG